MGLGTANIQPLGFGDARNVPSAFGMRAIAVTEFDGFGRHKHHSEIDRGTRRAYRALASPVAIGPAARVHAEQTEKVAGQTAN